MMISNQAASPSKPVTARLQQKQSLLPSNQKAIKDFLESKVKENIETPNTNTESASDDCNNNISQNVKTSTTVTTTEETGTPPGYAQPKRPVRRVRSKTPPRTRGNQSPRRGTKSPIRPRGKSPAPKTLLEPMSSSSLSSSKSPMRASKSPMVSTNKDQNENEMKRIILSPKSQRNSERQNRPSFQGMSVVDGKRKSILKSDDNVSDLNKMRDARRRKSLDMMRNSAQSEHIREMLEDTMDECISTPVVIEGTAEERLQAVMTKAKETGMQPEDIFKFFNGGNPNKTHIDRPTFLVALEKLGDTFVVISEDELSRIIEKFDHNQDGLISIDEFKHYCYEIPTLPWKAERTRLEKSGELRKLRAQLSRRFTLSDKGNDENSCGDEVYQTTKFFWKTNNNVEIRLYYTDTLNVITVQMFSQTFGKEIPSIYVCRNKVEYQLKKHREEEESQQLDKKYYYTIDDMPPKERKVEFTWSDIAKYIIIRLKLKTHGDIAEDEVPQLECAHIPSEADCIPFLCKLTGDTFDTLMIQKPLNLHPPPSIAPSHGNVSGTFEEKVKSFNKEARRARESRQSAEDLTNLVASALSEVEEAL